MQTPNNTYRYKLIDRLGSSIAEPLKESDFQLEWTPFGDGRAGYRRTLPSSIKFVGAAYRNLLKLEQSTYRCDFITITVERPCTASGSLTWKPEFTGMLGLNDGSFDLDNCSITIKASDIQPEQCYDDGKETEVNLLSSVQTKHTVNLATAGVTIEKRGYFKDITIGSGNCYEEYWGEAGTNPNDGAWIYFYTRHYQTTDDNLCHTETQWAREVTLVNCGDPLPGSEWILVEDNCPSGQQKYARPARTYACKYNPPDPNDSTQNQTYQCSLLGDTSANNTVIDDGMLLSDVIAIFMANMCPGLQFVSNFFQINPDVVSTTNYVTSQKSKVLHHMVFQKSDVKRPFDSNNATQAVWTFEKLLDALIKIHNLKWEIDNGVFRLEHVSYFSKGQGIDLTQPRYARNILGKRKYSYTTESIYKEERFTFMEASPGDFAGVPIQYTGACVSTDSDNNIKTYSIEDVTTDVELCLSNPDSDSERVSDEGFVIMACDLINGQYYLITEAPIIPGNTLNNSLSWAHLQRDYWKYDRPLSRGMMNGVDTAFLSTRPTKRGEAISIPFCCDDTFDPNDLITGPFGQGEVEKASFSFKTGYLNITLLYSAEAGLTQNAAPVAVNDVATTHMNQAVIINPIANDSDSDGVIVSLAIVGPPIHGTAVANPDNTITYTPATGYTGLDNILYQVYDDWNQSSNAAMIAVTITNANQGPVAGNDSYFTNMNTQLTVAAPGVFANDSDDTGFQLDYYDTMSAQGGVVVVNGNGSIIYTPASGFVGTDTFTYRIKDTDGVTATATVTIDVRNPNNPVAAPDSYSTKKNTNLTVPAPGVLTNDTTSVGTLTAVAGTVTTAQGGSATIAADGSFTYVPLAGYTGIDTFPYTASNGTGTDTETVTVNVLPDVYVRMQRVNDQTQYLTQVCNSQNQDAGQIQTATFRAFFYSNSAGTTPLDVTGYGLTLNYRITSMNYDGSAQAPSDITTGVVSGATYDIFDGTYYRIQYDCSNNVYSYLNENFSLLPGNYTILS